MTTTAAAYDNGRQRQWPMTMAVVAYNGGRQRQQPTMVAAAAYIDDSRGRVIARDGGVCAGGEGMRELILA